MNLEKNIMSNEVDLWNKIVKMAMAIPFVKVNREEFLKKKLSPFCTPEQIQLAITETPIKVLTVEQIHIIAKGCIKKHLTLVCGVSALAGLPGGWGMAGTIPADIAQFYAHVFALTQKLIYIYGWPDLPKEEGKLTDEAVQILTLFTGVMMGSNDASDALKQLANAFAQQIVVKLPKHALTQYAIFNISKQIAKWIGVKLTKYSFSRSFSKVIPIIGAPASAGLTYCTFKPMANKLKKYLDVELKEYLINMSVK